MSIITSTNKLKVTELDFDTIKAALKEYLSGQSEFTDYNFDSSGMSILLDILAYNNYGIQSFSFLDHIYGVQFHPEVVHTSAGQSIIENFLFKICKCIFKMNICSDVIE